ncbi:MAG: hypothetical protein ACXVES_13240 [Actinomycetota bacterium]
MKTVSRSWKIAAITLAIVMIPVVALAAVGSFTSSTTTPAVTAKNTSATAGAKAIYGLESSTASGIRTGIVGQALGTGGVGVTGTGARYGLYSNGPIGVASGKNLVCSGCVTSTDLAVKPPKLVSVSSSDTSTVITSCAAQDSITIVAPSAGTVLVTADFFLQTNHTNGSFDETDFYVNTSSGGCASFTPFDAFAVNPPSLPTDIYYAELHITHPFSVAAGSHTYFLNAKNYGGGTATHYRDNMTALFIGS